MSADIVPGSGSDSYSTAFYIVCGTALTLIAYRIWETSRRSYKIGQQMPGLPTKPFFGNALDWIGLTDNEKVSEIMNFCDKFGNHGIARAFVGPFLIVFLYNPYDVEVILSSSEHLEKSNEYKFFKPWLGDGLLISKGEKWHRDRKLIAPAFHQNVLKGFVDAFNRNSLKIVKKMQKEIGKEFDVHHYMSAVTVDTLLETAMGTKQEENSNDGYNYAMAVLKMCDILHMRAHVFYLRSELIFRFTKLKAIHDSVLKTIHDFSSKVFLSKRKEYQELAKSGKLSSTSITGQNGDSLQMTNYSGLRDDLDELDENDVGEKRRPAFLELMIETAEKNKEFTEQEIKEQIDTIMFEGHDTLAAASSFVLCVLGVHHDIQEKVMAEQKAIFGDTPRAVTFADVVEMKYLERVILETLRMYPPVPIIARQLRKDTRIVTGNYTLPAGTPVVIATFMLHRDDKHFSNPNEFNPDNFLPEVTQKRHFYSFIPFSAGPRSCVGRKYAMLKLKILLSTILRNYRVKSDIPESEFKFRGDIILKRDDGFRIQIEPRHQ